MQFSDILHMNEGTGETSYARNSTVQRKVLELTKPIREEAIKKLYKATYPKIKTLVIAELGCASGPNMLFAIRDILTTFDRIRQEVKDPYWDLDFQLYLNDLPCNDFNSVFRSIPEFIQRVRREMVPGFGSCFVNGVPGSFHDRLFPCKSLHFVHSSYGLHWLSQVPKEVVENNKGNIIIGLSSPGYVVRAYYDQFQNDFLRFLSCRSEEMVKGGCMVFTLFGRKSQDHRFNEYAYMWELLAMTLRQMTIEGLIKEDKMNSFNIPIFTPTLSEIMFEIKYFNHFTIIRTETYEVLLGDAEKEYREWNFARSKEVNDEVQNPPPYDKYLCIARSVRAMIESIIVHHFKDQRLDIDDVFRRYEEIVRDCMTEEKSKIFVISVSLAKNKV